MDDQSVNSLRQTLLTDVDKDVPILLRERRSWRTVSEQLEVASKIIITIGGIVSYAACGEIFGGGRIKLIAFVGGSMNTVGMGCLNLASYAKQQANEREHALQAIAEHHNVRIPNVTASFQTEE
jgi:hypothetical protein